MELQEFRESIVEQVKFNAVAEMSSEKEQFMNYVTEVLMDAEEIEEFNYLPFEGLGKHGRKIQIDGYSYNELDNILTIFVTPSLIYLSEETLTNTDAEKIFSRARAFIEDPRYIQDFAEESAPGYGLAVDIQGRYKDVNKYCIYLLTDMVMSKNIKDMKSISINGTPVELHIWDMTRLHQLSRSTTGKEDIVINLKDFHGNGIPCLPASKTGDYSAYLCNIPGIVLAELYNTYGGRLLEGNVRSFLQTKGKVNKGIRNTILNNPSMFFAYNNGIAATAYNIKIDDIEGIKYITEITSLQIVNGGQTTASLAMSLINDKKDDSENKIKEIYVPMKLSIVSPENAQELIPNISRYANSQNKVSDADLWSNHPFHIRMEDFSRRTVAPATSGRQYGTYWYYERANGQYKQATYKCTPSEKKHFEMRNPSNQLFKKTDLAKYMNLFQMRPDLASAGGQKSFMRYADFIAKQWEKDDTVFNEGYFKRVVSLAIIFKESDRIVRQQPWYNSYKANIVAYTISKIIHTVKIKHQDKSISFKSIWAKQALSNSWVKQIEIVSEIMYNHLIDAKRPVQNVTEWAKRESCWEQAKDIEIQLLPEYIKELNNKVAENQQNKDEQKEQKFENKLNVMVEVANFGVDNWKELIQWDSTHHVLNPIDINLVNSAIAMEKNRFPSEKQCTKILQVLEKARLESFSK
jgi:hypothetical protein